MLTPSMNKYGFRLISNPITNYSLHTAWSLVLPLPNSQTLSKPSAVHCFSNAEASFVKPGAFNYRNFPSSLDIRSCLRQLNILPLIAGLLAHWVASALSLPLIFAVVWLTYSFNSRITQRHPGLPTITSMQPTDKAPSPATFIYTYITIQSQLKSASE